MSITSLRHAARAVMAMLFLAGVGSLVIAQAPPYPGPPQMPGVGANPSYPPAAAGAVSGSRTTTYPAGPASPGRHPSMSSHSQPQPPAAYGKGVVPAYGTSAAGPGMRSPHPTGRGAQPAHYTSPQPPLGQSATPYPVRQTAGLGMDPQPGNPISTAASVRPAHFDDPVGEPNSCNCRSAACFSSCSSCRSCSEHAWLIPNDVAGFSIGGWLQQGYTANFAGPANRLNRPLLFNDRSNDYQLNQLYLFAERAVHRDRLNWDVGGRVDVLLGTDARFLTVPGLEEHRDRSAKWNGDNSDYGVALPQAYVEFGAPWMQGVTVKAGHFYSIAGYETAPAPENFFYSHAYTYVYGEPFTHTGALVSMKPSEGVTIQAGYTNGWDVWNSNSNEYGILAGVTLQSADNRTSLSATVHTGHDVTNFRNGGALVDEARHFYSLVFQHQINPCWRYVFQHDFGLQEDAEIVVNTAPRTITFSTGKWYGINQYLIYDMSEKVQAGLRVEWFRDQDHSRLGVPVVFNPAGPTLLGGNYVAVTGGFNWRPNPNINIRPEVRWDYSDLRGNPAAPGGNPNLRAFNDNSDDSQVTAAVDVIVRY